MKNKLRSFMVLAALAVCFGTFSVTAYAQSNEPQTEPAPVEETTEPEETAEPNPFTPNGTGTVLDNATSEDEKEFYTIVTEDENVFYLVRPSLYIRIWHGCDWRSDCNSYFADGVYVGLFDICFSEKKRLYF